MPSSRFLAGPAVHRLVDELIKEDRPPLNILELGPGTGIFTERILPNLKKEDHMDVVEINDYFFTILSRRFSDYEEVHLHHQDFLSFDTPRKYDFVISSLPYESIPTDITDKLWEHTLSLCRNESFIVYYKYLNLKNFRSQTEKKIVNDYCMEKKIVLLNVPPARLFTLKIKK